MNKRIIAQKLDDSKLTKQHIIILVMCTLCMIIDGFDVQAISFVAPTLMNEWQLDKQAFGPVFGAGLLGMAVGALTLAPLADKFGRKPILMVSMVILSISMFATIYAQSVQYLIAVRFIAGLSLGAIVPNSVALAGEFSPLKNRVTVMMVISSGFILGGVVGGAVASYLIPNFGWEMVFIVGAIAPLLMLILMALKLPESLLFLAVQHKKPELIVTWLQRLGIEYTAAEHDLPQPEESIVKARVRQLFQSGLGMGTCLLWVILFMNLLATFFLANWLPILIAQAGYGGKYAVWAGAIFWFGGLIGNLVLGRFIDRYGFGISLFITFIFAMLFISSIGMTLANLSLTLFLIACTGFCILGAQTALNALAAVYYPTEFRSTGAGWALGIGRLGSIFGPVIGGVLMAMGLSTSALFISFSFPILIAAISIFIFWKMNKLPTKALATSA